MMDDPPPSAESKALWLALLLAIVALLAGLFLAFPLFAAVTGYVQTSQGRIELHDEAGPLCVGTARRADYIGKDGTVVGGCWTVRGSVVAIVFLDGDVVAVPLARFKPAPV